ncbi:ACP S-malonyltransferase [Hellea sp.]|nr:ACP S-malonyltransferase [Hellea sp.]
MTFALTFPGQGSQKIGMGESLAANFSACREVFDEVDDALSQNLSKLMWHGEINDLTLTANAQPALMACGIAAIRALETECGFSVSDSKYVAGHSLGEYTALCAAGSISLRDTALLLRARGNAMQAAVSPGLGAMAALLGASINDAETVISRTQGQGICQIANDNAVGQIVISGDYKAVEKACSEAALIGIKKAIMLNVSAPFHSSLMSPAAEEMSNALSSVEFMKPLIPVVSNVKAKAIIDPKILKNDLILQVTDRVRWRESVLFMYDNGIEKFIEPGCGKVLTVMLRRIVKGLDGISIDTAESLDTFSKKFKG